MKTVNHLRESQINDVINRFRFTKENTARSISEATGITIRIVHLVIDNYLKEKK